MKPKIIAFHLPQFHAIKENDKWWGKGFTEWVNTKKGKPLFKNHIQPKEPLNNNYYNMLDINTLKLQCELSNKYGIYGFCYYHYWFNGKLLLEKPVENLLANKSINQKFCFCWANEPWTRAWDGYETNVLMQQTYGDKKDWEDHFKYFLQFFKDKRYICIDNKPILVLYRTNNIDKCEEMISFWNELACENGFSGLYVIEEKNGFQHNAVCKNSDAILEFEPLYTMKKGFGFLGKIKYTIFMKVVKKIFKNKVHSFSYDCLWKNIIRRKRKLTDKKCYVGAFVDWDNTARKNVRGCVVKGTSPKKFEKYLTMQMKNAENISSNFIFINAWNEWGEGAYLEPDKHNKYAFLEALKRVVDKR